MDERIKRSSFGPEFHDSSRFLVSPQYLSPDFSPSSSLDSRLDRLEAFQATLHSIAVVVSKRESRLRHLETKRVSEGRRPERGHWHQEDHLQEERNSGARDNDRRRLNVPRLEVQDVDKFASRSGREAWNDQEAMKCNEKRNENWLRNEDQRRTSNGSSLTLSDSHGSIPSSNRTFLDFYDEDDEFSAIFKKSSANEKVKLFLNKREIVDDGNKPAPLDGVVWVDPDFLSSSKLFVHIIASFEFGRADLDILGVAFSKDIYRTVIQVYPLNGADADAAADVADVADSVDVAHAAADIARQPRSKFQTKLISKFGSEFAFPFWFEMAANTPSSVTMGDGAAPCGIFFNIEAYVADEANAAPKSRSSVAMKICKLSLTPMNSTRLIPNVEESFGFLFGKGEVKVRVDLGKSVFLHGEEIVIDVEIHNDSKKTLKSVTTSINQSASVFLRSKSRHVTCVVQATSYVGFPIGRGTEWKGEFKLRPKDQENREGLALDGALKTEAAQLASSTFMKDRWANQEYMGIIIDYFVKVHVTVQGGKDIEVRLPFALTHPSLKGRRRSSVYASSQPSGKEKGIEENGQ